MVGKIQFTGNEHVSSRVLRESMKNLRPIGIPKSIFLENLFPRVYDASKLEEDSERVRQAYQDRGYFRASVGDPQTHLRNEAGLSLLTFRPKKGKRIDILMPIDEGGRYRLSGITFTGNKAVTNVKALRGAVRGKGRRLVQPHALCQGPAEPAEGLWHAGLHQLCRDSYADHRRGEEDGQLQHRYRRGQAVLCLADRVPGQYGHARLCDSPRTGAAGRPDLQQQAVGAEHHAANQLDYFNPLKVDQDSETHQNAENGTVDLLLKVTEKGKNSIGLNGGVSGLGGSFLGVNYQTNNFLGLGETLTAARQCRRRVAHSALWVQRAVCAQSPAQPGLSGLQQQVRLQRHEELQARRRQSREPVQRYAVAFAEVQPDVDRIHGFGQLPHPPQLQARRSHLQPEQLERHDLQRGFQQLLPDAGFPQRHPGAERARRHSD